MYFNEYLLDVIVDSDNHIMLIMGHLVYLIINIMIFFTVNLFSFRQHLIRQAWIRDSHIGKVPTIYLVKFWFGQLKPRQYVALPIIYI